MLCQWGGAQEAGRKCIMHNLFFLAYLPLFFISNKIIILFYFISVIKLLLSQPLGYEQEDITLSR